MDLNAFVESRRPAWRRLEALVARVESGGAAALRRPPPQADPSVPDPDPSVTAVNSARELAQLYKQACGDLIRARSETANSELIGYLNGLVGRAYGVIYRGRRFRLLAALRFVLVDFPRLVRARWGSVLLASALLFAGAAFGWIAETNDPSAKHYLLPPMLAQFEEGLASAPPAAGGTAMPPGLNAVMSSFIMTHNMQTCFGAFALGATAGVGTAWFLFYNGLLIGVLAAICHRHDLSLGFWALILPHGVIELTAIAIAGAAGLLVGRAIVAPGDRGRRAALADLGREAVQLVAGCCFFLFFAGLIEGFVTPQPWIPPEAKLAIGGVTGVFLVVHLIAGEELLLAAGWLDALGGVARPASKT